MRANDVNHHRARVAALTQNRVPDDSELVAARQKLFRAQRTAGASAVLQSVEARLDGNGRRMAEVLRVPSVPIGIELLEAVEIIAYLVGQSDRPVELLDALRAQVIGPADD